MGYFTQKAYQRAERLWGVSFGDEVDNEKHVRLIHALRRVESKKTETKEVKPSRYASGETHYWRQRAWEEGAK